MSHHHERPEPPTRRSFLDWAIHGIGAIFAVVFGIPIVSYAIDPRNRPNPPSNFRPVAGIKLGEVAVDVPVQGAIRNIRFDSWTLYPNDVIGRVWIRRTKPGKTKDCFEVFSTVCPHLGCSINCNPDHQGFTCPCHNGQFESNGVKVPNRAGYENPAPRNMDTLEFEVERDPANPDEENRDLLVVKYQSFEAAKAEKIVRT